MKRAKIIFVAMLTLIMGAVPVSAAETRDEYYSFEAVMSEEYKTTPRQKTNTTQVYMYYTKGLKTLWVTTYGVPTQGRYSNQTKHGKAYVDKGVKSQIRNYIYEAGYRKASIGMLPTFHELWGHIYGCWSPDSKGSYTIVNN